MHHALPRLLRNVFSAGCLAFGLAAGSLRATAADGDVHWDRGFGWPGVTNTVFALRSFGSKLYAGGFSSETLRTNSIDLWDGTRWSRLATALDGAALYDFEEFQGEFYAAGVFQSVEGVTAPGLARWDGTRWAAVGGFAGAVSSLATDGNSLFVAGSFSGAGGVPAENIARWDGQAWSAMGTGLGPYVPGGDGVSALAWTGSGLYAAGSFTRAGAQVVHSIAYWDGNQWSDVGGGLVGNANAVAKVYGLSWDGTDLYAGGLFTFAGTRVAVNVARWNGEEWFNLGGGLQPSVQSVLSSQLGVFAVGDIGNGPVGLRQIVRWDADHWTTIGQADAAATELVVHQGQLIVGGAFNKINGRILNHIARWDGATWSPLGSGNGLDGLGRVVAATESGMVVGGSFTAAGDVPARYLAEWDGSHWSTLSPSLGGPLTGGAPQINVIAVSGSDFYVGGSITQAGSIPANNIVRWDRARRNWNTLAEGVDGAVTTIAPGNGVVYVGGAFTTAGGAPASHIAVWDGVGWSGLGGGVDTNVLSLVVAPGGVFAGGSFTLAGGSVPANNIARWTGSAWVTLGEGAQNGVNGSVVDMAIRGSDLFVGGRFTKAGGVDASGIARWDGTTWHPLGTGLVGGNGGTGVNRLAVSGRYVYVGGNFTSAGGVPVAGVARWDGVSWSGLGSGLSISPGSVSVGGLASRGEDLYAVGRFFGAGGIDSRFVARWNDQLDFGSPSLPSVGQPVLSGGHLLFQVSAPGGVPYVLQGSKDLSVWRPILTNLHPAAVTSESDLGFDQGPLRFFRAVRP